MNSALQPLCSEIWTIKLTVEAAIKFNDLHSKVSLATSKAESIPLMSETLKFLIIHLEQVDAFS